MDFKLKQLFYGLITFLPLASRFLENRKGSAYRRTGGTNSARYCYSVWLRHLVLAEKNGLDSHPKNVLEIGPGDSLGIGLASLISGSERYYGFDVIDFTSRELNLKVFDQLVDLFKAKVDIPDEKEFPKLKPYLSNYKYPKHILTTDRMIKALDDVRIRKIREELSDENNEKKFIYYQAPLTDLEYVEARSIDFIISQAVLEYVKDIKKFYKYMYRWLTDSGCISHQIDFKSSYSENWNGHWTIPNWLWRLIIGKRPIHVNRDPLSWHLRFINETGFEVVCQRKVKTDSTIKRIRVNYKYKKITDDDLITSGVCIQAIKRKLPIKGPT